MNYQIGTSVFKDWKITRELGEGAYGKVFEIEKNNFGITTTSALKVLQVPKSQSDVQAAYSEGMDELSVTGYFQECVERLVREIAILSELKSHPHIVGYEDHDVIQRTDVFGWDILIRMELLTSLQSHQRTHTLTEADVIQLGCDMCNALSYCHKKGLIHRDIKPANIFLNDLGQYKLGDFGVSRNMEATISNMSKAGTESYMAPEVYYGRPYSPNVDLYSLGLVLFQLTNGGRLPFLPPANQPMRFSDREAALHRRMSGEPLPTPVDASIALAEVIRKACAYDPKDRYQTADEMLEALTQLGQPPHGIPSGFQSTPSSYASPYEVQNFNSGLNSLEELDDGFDGIDGLEEIGSNHFSNTDTFDEFTDEFEDKTEATLSAFGGRPQKKNIKTGSSTKTTTPPQTSQPTGKIYTHKTPFGTMQTFVGDNPSSDPIDKMFGQFFGNTGQQAASAQASPTPTAASNQSQNTGRTTTRPDNQTPTIYFDRQPSGINKELARKNIIPGQAEVWVTRNLMNGIAHGSFPGLSLAFFFDNGICWKFTGNTLKGYMTELQKAVDRGLHTITIINRFPELPGLQETIYLHLQEIQGDDAHTAMYDGVSAQITRLGESGWIGNQNTKPRFYSDPCGNPFYGITSFLYQPPKRVRITSALAEVGTHIVMSGFGEPKKVMTLPPMAANLPSYLGNMTEELQRGQAVDIAEFFRVEAIVPSTKLALWLPDDGVIYTAMLKGSAKEGKFTKIEHRQGKYASLKSIFE